MRPLLLAVFLTGWTALAFAQDEASTRVIPETPAPGQPFRVEITLVSPANDSTGPALRVGSELPLLETIPLRFSGQRFGGWNARGTTTLLLSGTAPTTPGVHRIPSFTLTFAVRKVRIPATVFTVRPLAEGEDLGLVSAQLELPERTVYIGETLNGRILANHGKQERAVAIFGLEARGEGLSFRNRGARSEADGMAADFELTPTRIGEVDLRISAVLLAEGPASGAATGSRDRPVVLARKIKVAAIPERGRPNDWGGAVGAFTTGPVTVSRTNPEIGESIRLAVTLRGEGNLERILPPEVPHGDAWDVLPVREAGRSGRGLGERTFTYQITPRLPGKLETPTVRLSAFNPNTRAFEPLVFSPLTVDVSGQAPARVDLVTVDPSAPMVTDPTVGTPPPVAPISRLLPPPESLASVASSLPRIGSKVALANVTGLFVLLAAVGWAARREWVTAHPEQMAKRRGRRAVARTLRRLRRIPLDRMDALVVEGLRQGAAPLLKGQYPALTAEDVLRALEGEVAHAACIRACFQRHEAGRFGGSITPPPGPQAREALASALNELHRRLCA